MTSYIATIESAEKDENGKKSVFQAHVQASSRRNAKTMSPVGFRVVGLVKETAKTMSMVAQPEGDLKTDGYTNNGGE